MASVEKASAGETVETEGAIEGSVGGGVQIAAAELVNNVAREDASLAVRRYFTIQGRDPFDEIEWELRDAFIPGKDGLRSIRRASSSQVLFADRDEHRRAEVLPRPHVLTRARAFGPPDDRPCRHDDRHLGPDGRLLRERRRGAHLRGRSSRRSSSTSSPPSTRRCGSTSVSRRSRSARRASSSRSRTRWTRSSTGSGAKG